MNTSEAGASAALPVGAEQQEALFRLITLRLMPILLLSYLIALLDRINIGYAELQMKQALGFSDLAFSFGASIFFIGYVLFEVPSNLLLERIGARKTLMRIMFCWGLVTVGMAFVRTDLQFYVMRFLLGAFEAGFLPGVVLYLTYWFPAARRGRAMTLLFTGNLMAFILAGPLSGMMLKHMDGILEMRGWQWLFILQGLPASLMALVVFATLVDRPEKARWLTAEQKSSLAAILARDKGGVESAAHATHWSALRDPRAWLLALCYFLVLGAAYSILFWQPTLIKSWGVQDLVLIGFLGSLPAIFGAIGMLMFGRSSDRMRERRWHFAAAAAVCAAGIVATIFTKGMLVPSLVGLCVMAIGQAALSPLLFTALSEYFPKSSAAFGLAFVSSVGNLGPSVIPPAIVWLRTSTGSQTASLAVIAGLFVLSALLFVTVIRRPGAGAANIGAPVAHH